MENYVAQCFIGPNCKPTDHSMLTVVVNCMVVDENGDDNEINVNNTQYRQRRYKFHGRHDEYLNSEMWQAADQRIISNLHENEMVQNKLDAVYNDLCQNVFNELDKNLQYSDSCDKSKRKLKSSKPYWNENLNNLRKHVRERETICAVQRGMSDN